MTKIKIGLFGFGVVGQGIYEVVRKSKNAHAEIVKICVRDPKKPRKIEVDPSLFTTSVDDILDNQNINLVVEVIDDADAAYNIVKRAMLRGIPVVSGSKTMLAKHLPELIEIQKTRNVALLYDASSCGSIPVIRNLEEYYDNDLLLEVKGILNGSSNYILSRVFDHKDSYANALAQAQALGFAESDPSFDIEGYDSLFKLVIITVHALGTYVAPERIFTYGISTIHDSDIQYAREKNVKIKLVAQVLGHPYLSSDLSRAVGIAAVFQFGSLPAVALVKRTAVFPVADLAAQLQLDVDVGDEHRHVVPSAAFERRRREGLAAALAVARGDRDGQRPLLRHENRTVGGVGRHFEGFDFSGRRAGFRRSRRHGEIHRGRRDESAHGDARNRSIGIVGNDDGQL